jgi:hypothetical protein
MKVILVHSAGKVHTWLCDLLLLETSSVVRSTGAGGGVREKETDKSIFKII